MPDTGAYRHRRRRDVSRAELATLQMVIGDANVDTAWTCRVLRRDHSVEYSAELMCGSGVVQRQSRTVEVERSEDRQDGRGECCKSSVM